MEVYLGEQVHDKTLAAVKVLGTHLTDQKDLREFINEARTFRLKHPHIVELLDFGIQDGGTPFLVMTYAPNGTLRQRHPKGTVLSPATIISYIKPIAAALQYAHDRRLIHRDIKPENMLLGPHDEIWLSDFGIAVTAHSTSSQVLQDKTGTVPYMAPEQIQGKPQPASDQYALGIVVYEWLRGTRPFDGSSEAEIALQHIVAPPPPLASIVSPEVEQVVLTALAKDPQQRFPSVQDFAQALEQACHSKQIVNFAALPIDLYSKVNALSVPELQDCFSGVQRSNLLRGLGHRIYSSMSSVSPDEVRQFGTLAAEGLSASELGPTELGTNTEATLRTLEQVAGLGKTQPDLLVPAAEAYVALLKSNVENQFICQPDARLRLEAIDELNRMALTIAVTLGQSVPPEVLSVLSVNLPTLINSNSSLFDEVTAGRTYIELLGAIASRQPTPAIKEQLGGLAREFSMRCLSKLTRLDKSVLKEFNRVYSELLAK